MHRPPQTPMNPWLSIGLRLIAAMLAILFVLEFTKMTIRMNAPHPAPAASHQSGQ
jgi:hypothetical protein